MHSPDIQTAVTLYYTKSEIGTADIRQLFGCCPSVATRLKAAVKEEMAKTGVRTWQPSSVNTKIAYQLWGINISECEKRLEKLEKLNILKGE